MMASPKKTLSCWHLGHEPRNIAISFTHLFEVPSTLPETNIAPKNGWLEYYFPIGEAYFQVRTVSFREGIWMILLLYSFLTFHITNTQSPWKSLVWLQWLFFVVPGLCSEISTRKVCSAVSTWTFHPMIPSEKIGDFIDFVFTFFGMNL